MPFFDPIRIGAAGAADTAFTVDRSLRFNNDDNTRLVRTIGSTSNRRTFTYSFWIKRTVKDVEQYVLYNGHASSTPYVDARFNPSHNFEFISYTGSYQYRFVTNRLFRDPSSWYHFVIAIDSEQATESNRAKLYINGVQETSFSIATYPSQNEDLAANISGNLQVWGTLKEGTVNDLDGYLAELNFIDGFQYDPSYFGETDATTGQWNPKKYTGSYGTNGFYLNFSDNSAATATTLGKDSSGNGNNFTPNNFVTGDAIKDSPTNNFSVFRHHGTPPASGSSIAEGNLRFTTGSSGSARDLNRMGISTFLPTSGKWYAEVRVTGGSENNFVGVTPYQVGISPSSNNSRYAYFYGPSGEKYVNTNGSESNANYGAGFGNDDIVGIYIDMDAGTPTVYFSKNGQWADGSGNSDQSTPTSGITLGDTFFTTDTGGNVGIGISVCSSAASDSTSYQANFGQDSTFSGLTTAGGNTDANGKGDFKYTVPANALAMCSANLPDPTILLPNKHFDTLLYSGTGSSQNITGLEFQPDWVWIKKRSNSENHELQDAVRGATKRIASNTTDAESTIAGSISAFNSNGFTVVDAGTTNENGNTYVAWNWNAGDTDGKTYTVTVVSDSGNKYRFDGYGTSAVTLDLAEGGTYIFNYPSAHPLKFSTTADGTHGGGSEYTTGVTHNSSTQVTIVVAASAPTLYYYCSIHSGMGGQVNTNSTLGSSNFDGSIQSTVKVNAAAGFSIVTYTGNGIGGATIGHGLGVKPNWIIAKVRNAGRSWAVGSDDSPWSLNLRLDENSGTANTSQSKNQWYETAPTSTKFYVGDGDTGDYSGDTNVNGENYVAYCFSSVEGYSKSGKYTGNGSNDGRFVYTGFKVTWLLIKKTNTAESWILADTKRNSQSGRESPADSYLLADSNNAESTGIIYDMLSNGFKFRSDSQNTSGHTYIYLAFAEAPFKYARAR